MTLLPSRLHLNVCNIPVFPGDKGHLSLETETEGRGDEIQEGEEVIFICDSLVVPTPMKNYGQNPTSLPLLGL